MLNFYDLIYKPYSKKYKIYAVYDYDGNQIHGDKPFNTLLGSYLFLKENDIDLEGFLDTDSGWLYK